MAYHPQWADAKQPSRYRPQIVQFGGVQLKPSADRSWRGELLLCDRQSLQYRRVLKLTFALRHKHVVADRGFDADTFHATLRHGRDELAEALRPGSALTGHGID